MPSFVDSFWSADYAAGLGVLFSKLQQGVVENRQVLTIARMRAEAEEVYGSHLASISPAVDRIQGGFGRDDGATVRKAYEGVRTEMEDAAKNHRKIAQNIRDLVVNPFSKWCDAHETRVQDSQDELQTRIKAHDKQAETVKKLRAHYFNKCRLVEDIEEENKLAFQDPETSPKQGQTKQQIPEIKVDAHREEDFDSDDEPYDIGDETFSPEQIKKVLADMLNTIKMGETKVPILGTYTNTSAGSDIVEFIQRKMNSTSVSYAERVGQDLISHGFLRLIGNVGNTFANSSKMFYQWRPKAFKLSGVPEKKAPLSRTFSLASNGSEATDSPVVGTINEYLANWNVNVLNSARPNETPAERLRREAREADDKYKAAVRKLDEMRCELEEAIFVHLKFLERCELDRLKAIKTVILDFSGTISNVIPSLQATVDNMMLFQETVQPLGDLRYLLENYRTGGFVPKVVVYENYYNKVDEQTFGVDLEARARADKRKVPLIITTLLMYLDNHYPDLDGDEVRRNVWLVEPSLKQVHELRSKVNDGKPIGEGILPAYDIPTVVNLFKLYLLELPDSLVSSHVYEIIRTIYSNTTAETSDPHARVSILQQTLSQLRLTNIATLDACMNHFTRLIELTSADEEYIAKLATALAPCILRPRTETSLTMEEKHAYRLVRDLFAHKADIFNELRRMSTIGHSSSVSGNNGVRPRAISTDESNRRAFMEERQKAIAEKVAGSRSRATSPAPSPRGSSHRRDRSIAAETRFPIQTSPTTERTSHRQSLGPQLPKRTSLEVPDTPRVVGGAAAGGGDMGLSHPADGNLNFGGYQPLVEPSAPPAVAAVKAADGEGSLEKRNSLGRSGARVGGRRGTGSTTTHTNSVSSVAEGSPASAVGHSVTLTDAPMDD